MTELTEQRKSETTGLREWKYKKINKLRYGKKGEGFFFMGMECLNTRFPGLLCLLC